MSDLIDRQAAIKTLEKGLPSEPLKSKYTEGITVGFGLAITWIEQLPAVQTCEDAVSRQQAIDALIEQMPSPFTEDGSHPADEGIFRVQETYADCIETIKLLPAADAIDRQKLVETIKHYAQYPDGISRLLEEYAERKDGEADE